jgi:uncharacterized repeat protein (TIGR01451 family)
VKRAVMSFLGVVLLLFLVFPVGALAAPPPGVPLACLDFAAQEIVVGFREGVTPPEMAEIHRQTGGQVKQSIPELGAQVVTVPTGRLAATIKAYGANPRIRYAEPNYVAESLVEPDDTYFDKQWAMQKIEAPAAWDVTRGSTGVIIAILDTGVNTDHPDLTDKIVQSVNFTDADTDDDIFGHGTHVAGIAAAATNNGIGVAGLGYDSSLMNVKVLRDNGSGYHSWIAAGITWAADNGAQVINMSLGGGSSSQLLEDAVNYAWSKGVVVVAAAGNNGNSYMVYPAGYANCIAVAATDAKDALASWSNYGDWVDLAAPGTGIYSTLNDDGYGYKSGTSMASPHVAGLAALVFTTVSDINGNGFLNDEVRARIESTCDDIGVEGIGSGRINAARAVQGGETEPQPAVAMVVAADPASVSRAGDAITYTYTITNTGHVTLTGINVHDDLLGNITLAATNLGPGASTSGTATYTVTQTDVDSGADIVNTATVTTDEGVTDSDSAVVNVVQQADVQIAVTADPTSVSEAGDVITYTYTVTNTGHVTLTGINVHDDLLGNITLAATTLGPGASTSGTATYTVTQADVDSGADIVNTATVTTDQGVTDSGSAVVNVVQQSDLQLLAMPDRTSVSRAGDVITYTYTVTNTGLITLTGINVHDDLLGNVTLAATALGPGASTSGTATYTVTQANIDSGADIVNTATVITDQGASYSDSACVQIIQQPDVQIIETPDPTSVSEAGDAITYTYTITNTGHVTLTGIAVHDDLLGNITLAATNLGPGASTSGTATYTVTQADVDSGEDIVNTSTVTTDQGVTNSDSSTVTVETPVVNRVLITPSHMSGQGWPGDDVVYSFIVENDGNVTDTYCVSVSTGWAGTITPNSVVLEPGASTTVVVTHTVPEGVTPGDFDAGTLQVISNESGASATAGFTTTARVSAVQITPDEQSATAAPGETVEYTYIVSNTGTENETYCLAVSAAWDASPSASSISLAPGASTTVIVSHTVPETSAGGDSDTGNLTVVGEMASSDAAFVTVVQEVAEPADPVIDLFNVTTTGNPVWGRLTVDWAVSDEDGDLASVQILIKTDGSLIQSAVFSVSGYEASGRYQFRERGGRGKPYEITLIVTDALGNTTTGVESVYLAEKTCMPC